MIARGRRILSALKKKLSILKRRLETEEEEPLVAAAPSITERRLNVYVGGFYAPEGMKNPTTFRDKRLGLLAALRRDRDQSPLGLRGGGGCESKVLIRYSGDEDEVSFGIGSVESLSTMSGGREDDEESVSSRASVMGMFNRTRSPSFFSDSSNSSSSSGSGGGPLKGQSGLVADSETKQPWCNSAAAKSRLWRRSQESHDDDNAPAESLSTISTASSFSSLTSSRRGLRLQTPTNQGQVDHDPSLPSTPTDLPDNSNEMHPLRPQKARNPFGLAEEVAGMPSKRQRIKATLFNTKAKLKQKLHQIKTSTSTIMAAKKNQHRQQEQQQPQYPPRQQIRRYPRRRRNDGCYDSTLFLSQAEETEIYESMDGEEWDIFNKWPGTRQVYALSIWRNGRRAAGNIRSGEVLESKSGEPVLVAKETGAVQFRELVWQGAGDDKKGSGEVNGAGVPVQGGSDDADSITSVHGLMGGTGLSKTQTASSRKRLLSKTTESDEENDDGDVSSRTRMKRRGRALRRVVSRLTQRSGGHDNYLQLGPKNERWEDL